MKQFVLLAALLVASGPVFAQEPLLPDGQYVIVSYDKETARVQKCEITSNKEGQSLKVLSSSENPESTPKPIRVFVNGDHFQFAFGPSDYAPEVVNKMEAGTTTYVGQLFGHQLTGIETHAGWAPKTTKFLLQKL